MISFLNDTFFDKLGDVVGPVEASAAKLGAAGLLSAEEDQDTGRTSHSEHTSEHVNNM